MKVLMGYFMLESNEHVPGLTELDTFNIKFGENLIDSMHIKSIFSENNFEIIPAIYASGHSGTVLSREAFEYIRSTMLRKVVENLSEIDAIYLFLHGASKIEGLSEGSGDRQLLEDIRKVTGPYLPIAVVMDPHGNLTEKYVNQMTIGRCYRESPHTDIIETFEIVAYQLIDLLNKRKLTHPVYRKLPFVLGGERSVSTDEPMLSINRKLNKIEEDERILSASFHVGYLRHDTYSAGSGLLIVPSEEKYRDYAEKVADNLKEYCIGIYPKFTYHGNALSQEDAINQASNRKENRIVLTDSGDNVTSGAQGNNTELLKGFLGRKIKNGKKILFAAITDKKLFFKMKQIPFNEVVEVEIGNNIDNLSRSVEVQVKKIAMGELQEMYGDTSSYGETITLRVIDNPIDIVIIEKPTSFTGYYQFEAANIDMNDYNVIVVKQGYIFPDLKEFSDYSIMVLTDGATNQVTEQLVFKQIKRPMLPFDCIGDNYNDNYS